MHLCSIIWDHSSGITVKRLKVEAKEKANNEKEER
jgi:hypothetical protein